MVKYILGAISADQSLKLDYLRSLAYTKFINKDTAIPGPEVDLIEIANIIMDERSILQ